ncbi:MAG: RsmD family RNA methyltransferase [Acidimicrobiales bacterium]
MRVIAGTARGRRLQAPPGRATRPITDRAKEGIFNMLGTVVDLDGATVVDLFAGSGSFGIEALSRGAAAVTFVEAARPAVEVLRRNLETLGFADRAVVETGPVERALDRLPEVDLAFCDPPYALDAWPVVLGGLRAGFVVGHAETPIVLLQGWEEVKRRTYGRANIVIARRLDPTSSPEGIARSTDAGG